MAREVVIHTWCDPEYQDELKRVDAETITWFLEGERWEIDLCKSHRDGTSIGAMDDLIRTYGRAWEDPSAPPKPKPRRNRSKIDPTTAPIENGHYDAEREEFFCTYPGCTRTKEHGFSRIQSFRVHQRTAHGQGIPGAGTEKTRKR